MRIIQNDYRFSLISELDLALQNTEAQHDPPNSHARQNNVGV